MLLIKHVLFLSLVLGNSNVTAMEDDRIDHMYRLPIDVIVEITKYLHTM